MRRDPLRPGRAPGRSQCLLEAAGLALLTLLAPGLAPRNTLAARTVEVGSKAFTESVILGEIACRMLNQAGLPTEHHRELGGTRILWNALLRGDIDIYPEYTGTLRQELLPGAAAAGDDSLRVALARHGIGATGPLGFNNTYALGVLPGTAQRLDLRRISDLASHPELRFGFTNEFLDRAEGWPSLKQRYGLPQRDVRGLDHDLAYRALASGEIDLTDLYSTDAEIPAYRLVILEDDRKHFPEYQAVYLYRSELAREAPDALAALERLAGTIDAEKMRAMNARVKLERQSESRVAGDFVAGISGAGGGTNPRVAEPALLRRVLRRTGEHLTLVGLSLVACIAVAVPLGVLAFRRPRAGQVILGLVGAVQTIPALALLVFMIPLLGIAAPPAVAALFLYGLLPIVRNTHAGLRSIPEPLRESALALGLSSRTRLFRVELPLASGAILAGVKTSAVITVGFATLGALIGAGGYGQPILTGIRLDNYGLILEGALPAALLALAVQGLFDLSERWLVPRGLRIRGPAG